jgi:NDP-sugar pyrophosphorylase family protein
MLPIAILAGGFGTRLGQISKKTPKYLVDVAGSPFADWQLKLLRENGYTNLVFCVSHKSREIQEYLGNGSRYNLNITYSLDGEEQLGTGGAIKKALPILGEKFAVIYGDSYLPINYSDAENFFIESQGMALMTVYKNKNKFDRSNIDFHSGKIVHYDKKNKNFGWEYIDYGLTYFRSDAFDRAPKQKAFDLSEIMNTLSRERKIDGYEVFKRFYEVGSLEGIKELSEYLRKEKNEF